MIPGGNSTQRNLRKQLRGSKQLGRKSEQFGIGMGRNWE